MGRQCAGLARPDIDSEPVECVSSDSAETPLRERAPELNCDRLTSPQRDLAWFKRWGWR